MSKFIDSEKNFNLDKGVDKKADVLARETAEEWCAANQGWRYTGNWKNERRGEGEVSLFEVEKAIDPPTGAVAADAKTEATEKTHEEKKADGKIDEELDSSKKTDAK